MVLRKAATSSEVGARERLPVDGRHVRGDVETLKWAREKDCPWDELTAGHGGHLETLKWARENGCPWDKLTCSYAAERGHLEVLKWAREIGCPGDG